MSTTGWEFAPGSAEMLAPSREETSLERNAAAEFASLSPPSGSDLLRPRLFRLALPVFTPGIDDTPQLTCSTRGVRKQLASLLAGEDRERRTVPESG